MELARFTSFLFQILIWLLALLSELRWSSRNWPSRPAYLLEKCSSKFLLWNRYYFKTENIYVQMLTYTILHADVVI